MKLIEISIKINFKEKFPKTYKRYIRYRFKRYLERHFSLGVWNINGHEDSKYYLPFLSEYTKKGIPTKYRIMKACDLIPVIREFARNEEVKLLKFINKK